eukprot:TRINITY_DN10864_c0_g2_i2.p1 TRINITY_DN10864_c0_g2~~TRINITY_DN10864_c0_g2_i2.p1  ORF type:complete len:419 (+),score=142.49 TRINITY_DN10864_c0_g2_i2:74-1330(+)
MEAQIPSTEVSQSQLIFLLLEYLEDAKRALDEDQRESLEVATQCISSTYNVNLNNEDQTKKFSIKPQSLPAVVGLGLAGKERLAAALEQLHKKQQDASSDSDIESKFAAYMQAIKKKGFFAGVAPGSTDYELRFTRAREKFIEKYRTGGLDSAPSKPAEAAATKASDASLSPQQRKELAEKHKLEGNQQLQAKKFTEAAAEYSRAIELDPSNAIYFGNRAAAYSHLEKHGAAVDDCLKAIELNPSYSKAHARLGLAYFSLHKYKESVDSYRKALELEPGSQNLKDGLEAAQQKLREQTPRPAPAAPAAGAPGGFNFANMMNMMGGGGGAGAGGFPGAGGPGGMDFSQILNNPMFANMAQQMMNNPAMMNMAQNLMQNPEMVNSMLSSMGVDPAAVERAASSYRGDEAPADDSHPRDLD